MREIKFRAWDSGDNLMRTMFTLNSFGNPTMWTKIPSVQDKDKFILMQYTGLRDKNGTEIYEGDILAPMKNDCEPVYDGVWYVVFQEGAFFGKTPNDEVITWLPYWLPDSEIEVIGNIYSNPELLK